MLDRTIALTKFESLKPLIGAEDKERDVIEHFINVCSQKISEYCNRTFVLKQFTVTLESLVGNIRISNLPINEIITADFVKVSDYEVTYEGDGIPTSITFTAGYILPSFFQVADPITPALNDTWLNDYGVMKKYDGTDWIVFDGYVVPYTLQQAVISYMIWMKKRVKSHHIGVTETRSGYSYEGTQIIMTSKMPSEVAELLEWYVCHSV